MTTIEGLYNFRDTGGTPLTAGGATRSGVLYRSDALSGLGETGLSQFAATPVGVVVDFRTPTERLMAPDVLPTSRPFRMVELSILEGAMTGLARQDASDASPQDPAAQLEAIREALAQPPFLGDLYVGMLQGGASAFAEVARLVAASSDAEPTAVVVHCTAGKDRTGVSAALILEAVGADRDAVVADYAASAGHLAGAWSDAMLATVGGLGVAITPAVRDIVTGSPAAAIEQALAWVDAEHGGAAGYLQSGGLTDDELAALRRRLAG